MQSPPDRRDRVVRIDRPDRAVRPGRSEPPDASQPPDPSELPEVADLAALASQPPDPPDASQPPDPSELPEVADLAALASLVEQPGQPDLFVRWSKGPQDDAEESSRDHASGLPLPGLAVNPLTPPRWWTLPTEDWLARQIRAYAHLGEDDDHPHQCAWVLSGRITDRGPDNEPLVTDVVPVARLPDGVLREAAEREPRSPREEDQDTSWRS